MVSVLLNFLTNNCIYTHTKVKKSSDVHQCYISLLGEIFLKQPFQISCKFVRTLRNQQQFRNNSSQSEMKARRFIFLILFIYIIHVQYIKDQYCSSILFASLGVNLLCEKQFFFSSSNLHERSRDLFLKINSEVMVICIFSYLFVSLMMLVAFVKK